MKLEIDYVIVVTRIHTKNCGRPKMREHSNKNISQ